MCECGDLHWAGPACTFTITRENVVRPSVRTHNNCARVHLASVICSVFIYVLRTHAIIIIIIIINLFIIIINITYINLLAIRIVCTRVVVRRRRRRRHSEG